MTLNEVKTQTADAIREKTGKSELIAPVNFAEEIKSISAGGGESGGEHMLYFDTSAANGDSQVMSAMCKLEEDGNVILFPTALAIAEYVASGADASAILRHMKAVGVCKVGVDFGDENGTQYITNDVWKTKALEEGWKEITEAEFYDLNA